jgi:hypothetical protein
VPSIQAHITKVEKEIDSEWGTIYTDHGSVKKLTTKLADKLTEAAEFKRSGSLASIEYTEKSRTVDTEGGPRTYRNYYFERAAAATNGAAPAAESGIDIVGGPAAPAGGPQGGRKTDPDDAWRMAITSGSERAVQTLPLMPIEQRDFETQKTIAKAWAEFIFFTTRPSAPTSHAAQPVNTGPGAYHEPDGPPARGDDDIPY